jgi:hypothetical protein
MGIAYNDKRLWWAGVATSVAVLGAVLFGRVRGVDVPRVAEPAYPVTVCVDESVPMGVAAEAVSLWVAVGHHIDIARPCTEGRVTVSVDRVRVDLMAPPDATMEGGSAHGVTDLRHTDGRITRAAVYLHDPTDVEVLAHELGHALGYLHARWAPAGHLMAPDHSRIGRDMRGLEVTP